MSAVEEDAVEFSLAPQWLRSNSLHSPIGAASAKAAFLRSSWNAGVAHEPSECLPNLSAGVSPSAGRQISLQHKPSSRDPGLETPHNRGLPQGSGSSRSEERPSGFRSPARRSYVSSRPYNSTNRSSRTTLEDRYNTSSSPFSSSTTVAKQNSHTISTSSNGTSAVSWLNRRAGQPAHQSLHPSSTAAGSQAGPPQSGVQGPREGNGLQRTFSEGSKAAHSSSSKVSRESALDSQGFPTLGSTISSNSSRRSASPEPYIPSIAPYKQEFLTSRSSLSWTSKLAAVPASTSDHTEFNSNTVRGPPAPAAELEVQLSNHSVSQGVEPVHDHQSAADAAASSAGEQLVIAAPPAAAAAVEPAVLSPQPAVLSPQPSLAETLRHTAAASATADAPKRHQSALLQLLPAPKMVTKQGSSTAGKVPTARQRDTSRAKAVAANRPKPFGPPATVPSPAVVSNTPTLVTLGQNSSSNSSSTSGASAGPAAVALPDGMHTTSSNGAVPQIAQQSCKAAGSVGSTAAAEQRQQVRDRHNFFAVLRRKNSSSSGSSGSGIVSEGHGTSEAVFVTSYGATDGTSAAGRHTSAAAAAEPGVAADAADPRENGDIHIQEQQKHAVSPQISVSSRCNLDPHGISAAEDSQPEDAAAADIGHCDSPQASMAAPATSSVVSDGSSRSKTPSQPVESTADACSAVDQLCKHTAKSTPPTDASNPVQSTTICHNEAEGVAQDRQLSRLTELEAQDDKQQQQQQQYHHASSATWDLPSEEEEEAFLRSLGWTAGSSEDEQEWELTEEEIAAFQAAAAMRAAQQQQHVAGHRQVQQKQQRLHGMHLGGCTGNHNAFGATGHSQQAHVVCAYGGDHSNGLYSLPVAEQSHSGLMLSVYMPHVVKVLERSGDSSDSSDDE